MIDCVDLEMAVQVKVSRRSKDPGSSGDSPYLRFNAPRKYTRGPQPLG
jgi:hypothetical protein